VRQNGEWTRGEVATYLGRSKSRVIELEKQGKLHPRRGDDGHWYHSTAEVEAYRRSVRASPARSNGADDANETEILRRIHAGEDAAAIAIDVRIAPRRLAELITLYDRLRGGAHTAVRASASASAHPTLWTMLFRSPDDQSRVHDLFVRAFHGEDVTEALNNLVIGAAIRITEAAREAGDI
jgi:hypothetical protein